MSTFRPKSLLRVAGLALVAACAPEEPAVWQDAPPPSVEVEGRFAYAVSTGFNADGGEGLWHDPWAFAQATFSDAPVALPAYPADTDACWTVTWEIDDARNVDVGDDIALGIGDERVDLERDPDGWYWWQPLLSVPAYATDDGRALTLDEAPLGVEVVPALTFTDFPRAWSTYDDTGDLTLRWEPAETTKSRIVIERWTDAAAGTSDVCVLADDGAARIVYPGPPPAERDPEYTLISRQQVTWVSWEGRALRVSSSYDIGHAGIRTR